MVRDVVKVDEYVAVVVLVEVRLVETVGALDGAEDGISDLRQAVFVTSLLSIWR